MISQRLRARVRTISAAALALGLALGLWGMVPQQAAAEGKAEKSFTGLVTDAQGVETEIKNIVFYWEEKLSETSFVPHELRHVPAKRGTATVNIKFDTIKQIDVKPGAEKTAPTMTVTLANGKSGDFVPAVNGSFKGESDFGPLDVPVHAVSKVVLK
ncbi:MAG: hypothetical protein U0172_08625 [Nitrospiraceae bacterium]